MSSRCGEKRATPSSSQYALPSGTGRHADEAAEYARACLCVFGKCTRGCSVRLGVRGAISSDQLMVRGVELEAARTIEQQLLAHGDVPSRLNGHSGKRARGLRVHHLDSLAVGPTHTVVDVPGWGWG